MGPGLYGIYCSAKGKVYFGESQNVVYRLGTHYDDLVAKKHECRELQENWNLHGETSFSFISLSVGPQWKNVTVRRDAETKLVKLNINQVYNQSIEGSTPKKESDLYRKPVKYKGIQYPSIAEASRITGVAETHIRRCARDPQNTDWQYATDPNILDKANIINIEKSKKVRVHGVEYRSIREAAAATNICRSTIRRHANSNKPEHAYVSVIN